MWAAGHSSDMCQCASVPRPVPRQGVWLGWCFGKGQGRCTQPSRSAPSSASVETEMGPQCSEPLLFPTPTATSFPGPTPTHAPSCVWQDLGDHVWADTKETLRNCSHAYALTTARQVVPCTGRVQVEDPGTQRAGGKPVHKKQKKIGAQLISVPPGPRGSQFPWLPAVRWPISGVL